MLGRDKLDMNVLKEPDLTEFHAAVFGQKLPETTLQNKAQSMHTGVCLHLSEFSLQNPEQGSLANREWAT